jgi:putative toxin-antitoxin system antitoxin component (TIGR02293 family)
MTNSEESVKLARLARVVARAEEVFEDLAAASHWLHSPNAALSGAMPLSLPNAEIGAEVVLETLGRIEHGVFAWPRPIPPASPTAPRTSASASP